MDGAHEPASTVDPIGTDRAIQPDPAGRAACGRAGPIVVCKFGGTSVADAARLRAVAQRLVAASRAGCRVVAVLSAMAATTDDLMALARTVSSRPPVRELDALLAVGESISCALAAMAIQELGERAVSLSGPQAGIHTDERHGDARLEDVRPARILAALESGAVVLVTGFQGISPDGDVTTLGRGGSDASAVAVAAALGLRSCEIYTDVDGVFTADPRVVPEARRLPFVGRDQMLQLAAAGAGVMQPRAVELAAAHDVDIHVRSSFSTEPGTRIAQEDNVFEQAEVVGVAHRDREALYAVQGLSPAAVTAALAARGAAIGSILRHGSDVRFTAPGADLTEVRAALAPIGAEVDVEADLGSVSVVGSGIGRHPDVAARALLALEDGGIDAQLVTSTPGRVALHVPAPVVRSAVRLLHELFALSETRAAGADLAVRQAV
jgi:aspartate kinase